MCVFRSKTKWFHLARVDILGKCVSLRFGFINSSKELKPLNRECALIGPEEANIPQWFTHDTWQYAVYLVATVPQINILPQFSIIGPSQDQRPGR